MKKLFLKAKIKIKNAWMKLLHRLGFVGELENKRFELPSEARKTKMRKKCCYDKCK